jgi:hypothetical protein
VDQVSLVQKAQGIQQLLCKDTDESGAQAPELVLLDQFVQVDTEKLKGKTEMLPVNEGVLQTQKVVIIILVVFAVQL